MKHLKNIAVLLIVVFSTSVNAEVKNETYFFSKIVSGTMDEVQTKAVNALKTVGFGVLSESDMHTKLNEKLGTDMKPYRLLGVCNPAYADKVIKEESNVGLFLPCKVLLKELDNGKIELVFANPAGMMAGIGNDKLDVIAAEVTAKLKMAFDKIE